MGTDLSGVPGADPKFWAGCAARWTASGSSTFGGLRREQRV